MPTFPDSYTTAIQTARKPVITMVLEIEGIPTAYSNRALNVSDWYGTSTRLASKDRPLAVVSNFRTDTTGALAGPNLSSAGIDFLGGRSDMGTLDVSLVDHDGSLVGLTGLRRRLDCFLRRDVTAGEDHWLVRGGSIAQLAGKPYVFCGQETMKLVSYTADVDEYNKPMGRLVVERGHLHSRAKPHYGVNANGEGDQVSFFPRHLVDRRVWLRVGYDAVNDNDCISAFVGTIRSFGWTDLGSTLKLSCEDFQTQMKRPLFTDLTSRWFKPDGSVKPCVTGIYYDEVIYGRFDNLPAPYSPPVGSRVLGLAGEGERADVAFMERITTVSLLGVNWEWKVMNPSWLLARQPGAATALGPAQGTISSFNMLPFTPMVLIGKGANVTGEPAESLVWPEESPIEEISTDHVLAILLMVLTSTGEGTNASSDPEAENWDVLPFQEWGLGIPAEEIDIVGIQRLARLFDSHRVRLPVVEAVTDAREWLLQLLRPFGYIVVVKADGKLGIAHIHAPLTKDLENSYSLTFDDVAIDSMTGQPLRYDGPASDGEQRLVAIKWSDSPYIRDGKLELREGYTARVGSEFDALATAGDVQPVEIAAGGLYSRDERTERTLDGISTIGTPWFRKGEDLPKGTEVAGALLAALQARFAGTPALYTIEVKFRQARLSVGDWVTVSLPALPNPFNGQRGVAELLAQVVRKTANLTKGTIGLELSITDAGNSGARFLAPSLQVSAWVTEGTIPFLATVLQNAFTNSDDYNDTDAFAVGDEGTGFDVRVYSRDHLYCSQKVRCMWKDANHVGLSALPILVSQADGSNRPSSTDPGSTDLIELADWGEQGAEVARRRFSYFGDETGGLMNGFGAAPTTAHKYG